jgi:3-phosphoshikimate 1-carboxyvinyltransferase
MEICIEPRKKIQGQIKIPGDKSISHRALLLSSLAEGTVEIEGLLEAGDVLSTLNCLRKLGVEFEGNMDKLIVNGRGSHALSEPENVLEAGNSGTTARLLLGLLAGQPFFTTVTGDSSLRRRPMGRVVEPLRKMGVQLDGRHNGTLLPLTVRGGGLQPLTYTLPVASAQVKSALLLAATYAQGITTIRENISSRDHTERMLFHLGGEVTWGEKGVVTLKGPLHLNGGKIKIPGDISSASFFMVAAALAPEGELLLEEVGINPTRTGIIDVLLQMGADLRISNKKEYNCEPVADIFVKAGKPLQGVQISAEMIPALVDEIPILAVAALFARGETIIKGAGELRLKESDRLQALTVELRKMGGKIAELPDGLIIEGGSSINNSIKGAECFSHGDHRIAMALAVAALFAEGGSMIKGVEAVQISFPAYFELLKNLSF